MKKTCKSLEHFFHRAYYQYKTNLKSPKSLLLNLTFVDSAFCNLNFWVVVQKCVIPALCYYRIVLEIFSKFRNLLCFFVQQMYKCRQYSSSQGNVS